MGEIGNQRLPGTRDWTTPSSQKRRGHIHASTVFPSRQHDALPEGFRRLIERIVDQRLSSRWETASFTDFGNEEHGADGRRTPETSDILARIRTSAECAMRAEDLSLRLESIMELKEQIEGAIEVARETGLRSLRHALVLIKHATHNTYAEDMTDRQLHGLVEATDALCVEDPADVAVGEVSDRLAAAGLEFIPAVPNE